MYRSSRYLVQGTGYRQAYFILWSRLLWSPYLMCFFFFFISSMRNYTCLHEFKNEVTKRRGKKTSFLNLKKSIRNGLNTKNVIYQYTSAVKRGKKKSLNCEARTWAHKVERSIAEPHNGDAKNNWGRR